MHPCKRRRLSSRAPRLAYECGARFGAPSRHLGLLLPPRIGPRSLVAVALGDAHCPCGTSFGSLSAGAAPGTSGSGPRFPPGSSPGRIPAFRWADGLTSLVRPAGKSGAILQKSDCRSNHDAHRPALPTGASLSSQPRGAPRPPSVHDQERSPMAAPGPARSASSVRLRLPVSAPILLRARGRMDPPWLHPLVTLRATRA